MLESGQLEEVERSLLRLKAEPQAPQVQEMKTPSRRRGLTGDRDDWTGVAEG